jgi:hypothetical protein
LHAPEPEEDFDDELLPSNGAPARNGRTTFRLSATSRESMSHENP